MASAVDQGDDAEVVGMDVSQTRDLAITYKLLNFGVAALPDEEASGDHLADLRYKVERDIAPYADFALFRPHGTRLGRAMKFAAQIWAPERLTYVAKEIPGPPTFDEWRRSWRCFRYACIVLRIVSPARLERYFENIQQLVSRYGQLGNESMWWAIALADHRMRSERMELLRRELEDERARCKKAGRAGEARLDPAMPWDAVFLAAADDRAAAMTPRALAAASLRVLASRSEGASAAPWAALESFAADDEDWAHTSPLPPLLARP